MCRVLIRLALPIAAVLAFASGARAQDCEMPGTGNQTMPLCPFAPRVTLSPGTAAVSQPSIPVAITAADHVIDGDTASFRVLLDSVDVTASWLKSRVASGSGTATEWTTTAAGVVTLSRTTPRRRVDVRQCDLTNLCDVKAAIYTLALPGVAVTPDGDATTMTSAPTRNRTFYVRNTGTQPATFQLKAECRDGSTGAVLTGCTVPASVTVAAGGNAGVSVTIPAPAGASFTISLQATQSDAAGVQDAGWMQATVTPGGTAGTVRSGPVLSHVNLNSAGEISRGQCVTAAVGAGAAYECGDLRLAHALPAHRTKGRTWQPVLLYNSQHAQPRTTVYWDVTLPANAPVPYQMQAVLYLASTNQAVYRTYAGSEWSPGSTRRIAVDFDASHLPTNQQNYYFQVIAIWDCCSQTSSVVASGWMPQVNRAGSPFGQGWWLAGLESLQFHDTSNGNLRLVWTGGDGSRRIYNSVGYRVWEAVSSSGPPDTLRSDGVVYTRRLRGGGRVEFDGSMQHVRTVNRLNQTTTFTWQNGRVTAVHMPGPGGGADPYYSFVYDAAGLLTHVHAVAPGAPTRTVVLGHAPGDRRVTSITDPDQRTVQFGFVNDSLAGMVRSRTDRRNTTQDFVYGPSGKLRQARLLGDTIVQRFEAVEEKGLRVSVPLVAAYTLLDGPRTDVADRTWIWHADRGAPRRIRDALGGETVVLREDSRFPALPTQVMGPGGHSQVVYDARGRVQSSAVYGPLGDARYPLTRYVYDDRWDAPVEIHNEWVNGSTGVAQALTAPVFMEYDAVGNRLWQQQGHDIARRAQFRYYTSGPAAGQLRAVQLPATADGLVPRDSLVYDPRGNLRATVSPLGHLTLHYRDALGRDTLVVTPTDAGTAGDSASLRNATGVRHRTLYDAMGRDTLTQTLGLAVAHAQYGGFVPALSAQQSLYTHKLYDEEGQVLRVLRWSDPDPAGVQTLRTSFVYDGAGRVKVQEDSQGGITVNTYDPVGNVTVTRTPRDFEIRMKYDALGRLVERAVPAAPYGRSWTGLTLGTEQLPFPAFPNHADNGFITPAETSYYRFDAAGNMVHAENGDAIVRRTYFPGGALKTDSLLIRDYGDVGHQHTYGLSYSYDMAGRLVALGHPASLAGSQATDQWGYDPTTGELTSAQERGGAGYAFRYDRLGRMTSLHMPGPVVDSMRYDVEGRTTWRREWGPGGPLHDQTTMQYDARGKLTWVNDRGYGYRQWYAGIGSLAGTSWDNPGDADELREEFRTDALGNVVATRTSRLGYDPYGLDYPWVSHRYQVSTSRVMDVYKTPPAVPSTSFYQDSTTRGYDDAGNVVQSWRMVAGPTSNGRDVVQTVESRSYYGADDRLRVFQQWDVRRTGQSHIGQPYTARAGVWEEYRYDPLGRRVLVRKRTDGGLCDIDAWTCEATVTRFVWWGDQLLWELRGTGSNLEQAYESVSYFHSGGIDRPLMITKGAERIVPHQNWRGAFSAGTYGGGLRVGQKSDCPPGVVTDCIKIDWPGWATTAWHQKTNTDIQTWYGSLVNGMRDASGQLYRRNRYYDPQTGQFTQTDPIGLAGGLNAYGFAAGDPVSYSDPYGLCADDGQDHADSTRTVNPREEARLRCIAANYLQPGVRGQALAMLDAKDVGVGDYRLREIDAYAIGSSIFFSGSGDYSSIAVYNEYALAKIFAHEIRHVNQSRWVRPSGKMSAALVGVREMDARDFEGPALVQPDLPRLGWDGVERCKY